MPEKATNPTALKPDCTHLEHRLSLAYCFLQTLVANALLRLYVWPYLPGHSIFPHLFILVITRAIPGIVWIGQYRVWTGRREIDGWLTTLVGFVPSLLVDLGLGGCYYECSVRKAVGGYCGGMGRWE